MNTESKVKEVEIIETVTRHTPVKEKVKKFQTTGGATYLNLAEAEAAQKKEDLIDLAKKTLKYREVPFRDIQPKDDNYVSGHHSGSCVVYLGPGSTFQLLRALGIDDNLPSGLFEDGNVKPVHYGYYIHISYIEENFNGRDYEYGCFEPLDSYMEWMQSQVNELKALKESL